MGFAQKLIDVRNITGDYFSSPRDRDFVLKNHVG